jgi:predicted Kef-type K+ transport protein
MPHLGIDIDQFILFTIYPAAGFFAIGFVAKKTNMRPLFTYFMQGVMCIAFSIGYFTLVPRGGAQGLAIVLGMFGVLLLFMARKQKIHPEPRMT